MGVEFELKFAANEQVLPKIARMLGEEGQLIQMQTTYYDTPSGALSALRYTLRLRRENQRAVCTLKTPGTGAFRGEWEVDCGEITQSINKLCKLGAPEELAQLVQEGLIPVCGAAFTRKAVAVVLPDAQVEVALDSGVLIGGNCEEPFWEVEVELKSGSAEAAQSYAHHLATDFGLTEEKKSKFRRALDLAKK